MFLARIITTIQRQMTLVNEMEDPLNPMTRDDGVKHVSQISEGVLAYQEITYKAMLGNSIVSVHLGCTPPILIGSETKQDENFFLVAYEWAPGGSLCACAGWASQCR